MKDLNSTSQKGVSPEKGVKKVSVPAKKVSVPAIGEYLIDGHGDLIGQLKSAVGKDAGGTSRLNEQFGYAYDGAGNLSFRTDNTLVQYFVSDFGNPT